LNAVRWPLVAVAGLFIFRKPITDLINRVKGFNPKEGFTTEDPKKQESVQEKTPSPEELMKSSDDPLLSGHKKQILRSLESVGTDPKAREEALVRRLAWSEQALWFENTYWLIYGSQLGILKALNGYRTVGASKEQVKEIYDEAVRRYPKLAEYSFDIYLAFLLQNVLIAEKDGRLYITPIGTAFLNYIVSTGKSEFRPF